MMEKRDSDILTILGTAIETLRNFSRTNRLLESRANHQSKLIMELRRENRKLKEMLLEKKQRPICKKVDKSTSITDDAGNIINNNNDPINCEKYKKIVDSWDQIEKFYQGRINNLQNCLKEKIKIASNKCDSIILTRYAALRNIPDASLPPAYVNHQVASSFDYADYCSKTFECNDSMNVISTHLGFRYGDSMDLTDEKFDFSLKAPPAPTPQPKRRLNRSSIIMITTSRNWNIPCTTTTHDDYESHFSDFREPIAETKIEPTADNDEHLSSLADSFEEISRTRKHVRMSNLQKSIDEVIDDAAQLKLLIRSKWKYDDTSC